MPNALDDWFVREILVHERALAQYLRRCRVDRDEQHDLRQEVYARVYEAAADTPPANPEAFLFTTARNLIADRVRRSRVVSIEPMGDFDASFVCLVDECSPERWAGTRQVLRRLADILGRLPRRCREVMWLRRVEDLSQKEVARRLGISERTVEKHLAKAIRLVADHLHGSAPLPPRHVPHAEPAHEVDGTDARQQAD